MEGNVRIFAYKVVQHCRTARHNDEETRRTNEPWFIQIRVFPNTGLGILG